MEDGGKVCFGYCTPGEKNNRYTQQKVFVFAHTRPGQKLVQKSQHYFSVFLFPGPSRAESTNCLLIDHIPGTSYFLKIVAGAQIRSGLQRSCIESYLRISKQLLQRVLEVKICPSF